MNKISPTKFIAMVGVFSALTIVLYLPFLRISLPFFPPFLKLQFSMLPVILGGFVLGPIGALAILVVKTLVSLPQSSTAYVGELADFLIGVSVVLVTSLIYKYSKKDHANIKALLLGCLTWVVSSCLLNYFVLVPFYIEISLKGDVDKFISLLSMIKKVDHSNYKMFYIMFAVIPFNLILSGLVSLITFFTYKKIRHVIYTE